MHDKNINAYIKIRYIQVTVVHQQSIAAHLHPRIPVTKTAHNYSSYVTLRATTNAAYALWYAEPNPHSQERHIVKHSSRYIPKTVIPTQVYPCINAIK
jgi:hypothetical protein